MGGAVSHDANGNRKMARGFAYTYDLDDRLVQAVGNGHTAQFLYDHAGQRVTITIDGPPRDTEVLVGGKVIATLPGFACSPLGW